MEGIGILLTKRDRPYARSRPRRQQESPRGSEAGSRCYACAQLLSATGDRMSWYDRHLLANHTGVVIAALGPLVTDHVLVLPRRHVSAFLDLRPEEKSSLLELSQLVARRLGYDSEYTVVEHGVRDLTRARSSCFDHAHLHVLPGSWQRPGIGFERVRTGSSTADWPTNYILWRDLAGTHVAVDPGVPQFLRRVISEQTGRPDTYDWALFPRYRDIRATHRLLDQASLAGSR